MKNRETQSKKEVKTRSFKSYGKNNCLGASLKIIILFQKLSIFLKENEKLRTSKKIFGTISELFDQFFVESDDVMNFYRIDRNLSKQLLDDNRNF